MDAMFANIHTLVGGKVAYSNIGMTDRSKFKVALKRQIGRKDADIVLVDMIDPLEGLTVLTRVLYFADEDGSPVREIIGTVVDPSKPWSPEKVRWLIPYHKGLDHKVYQITTIAHSMDTAMAMDTSGEVLYTDSTNFADRETGQPMFLYTVQGNPAIWGTYAKII